MKTAVKQTENIVQDTKRYIVNAARHLFSDFSYLGVSMNDIAKKLNITKAALYYHFNSKAEIYINVLDDVFDNLDISISEALASEKTIDKKLRKLIKNYLDFGFKEKNLIKSLMLKMSPPNFQIKRHILKLRGQTVSLIQPVIREMIISKKLTQKVDSRLLTSLLTGMMDGLLLEYSFLNRKIDSDKVSDQIATVLF